MDRVTPHRFRFSLFALIGGGVFIAGLALQILLVRYARLGPDSSYAAQAIFSIELSYLLNRHLTWRDRSVGWWSAAVRFNAQKLLTTVVTMAAYALLVRFGLEYVIANVLLTMIFTPVNYFAADLLVFVRGGRGGAGGGAVLEHAVVPVVPVVPEVLPVVSVVVPCKDSGATIRATVESLLGQDYPALAEVIVVGDVDDSAWPALAGIADPRLILVDQEATPGRRDPNVKRDKGIRKSSGEVIALVDSDVVVGPGWLGRGVALLCGQGGGLVAGGIRSVSDTFWGRFVDDNVMAAKTPRVPRPYLVTARNFGARGCKPPITANAVFPRELYDAVQLDTAWAYGYEDYEWFWRLARAGHPILFASDLTAAHHHRRSFGRLVREYRQSAHGCAQFIRAHPDSPLARKRLAQAFGLPLAALAGLGLGGLAVAGGHGALVAGLLAAAAVLLAGREVGRSRRLEGLTYPPVALALGGIYALSIAGSLLLPGQPSRPSRAEDPAGDGTAARSVTASVPAGRAHRKRRAKR
jgi:putative flippase GtrA